MTSSRLFVLLILAWSVVLSGASLDAQDTTDAQTDSDPFITEAYRPAVLYNGPGDTHRILGTLQPEVPVRITERNRVGNWLHVVQTDGSGNVRIDGWVLSGYLDLNDNLRHSEVPVNEDMPDADPSNVGSPSLEVLYDTPVISSVSERMAEVYAQGQEFGNRRKTVTKVGDSLSADPLYLSIMQQDDYALGPYDYLEETLNYYLFVEESAAAQIGLASYVAFDPMWADDEVCRPNETPLICEYRLTRPAIAFIMFGPNDVMHTNAEDYESEMRNIVRVTLDRGIIPVLSTFTYHPESDFWWQSVDFNTAIVEIARDFEVPLINLWLAARPLPVYGLDIDNIHMKQSGFANIKFDTGHEAWYGTSLRNLLTLRMLHEIRVTLELE